MAKRNYKKKTMKVQPAVLSMIFNIQYDSEGAKQSQFIDLSQCASIMNRRFYRQGLNWAVSGFKVLTEAGVLGQVSISKLPNTWIMSNSWEKGFRSWQRMNNEALDESPSIKPKFLDFKIFADENHHNSGFAANLIPQSSATDSLPPQVATTGEWESSKLRIPDAISESTREREIIAVGANYPGNGASGLNAVSLVEGYAASRGLPNVLDPNTPSDADDATGIAPDNWISALFNEGTEQTADVIEDMISENNIAPYPFENDGVHTDTMYPGGANQLSTLEIHDVDFITGTTVGGTTRMKGGNFPCGLIAIGLSGFEGTPAKPDGFLVQVDLVPGTHRGYLCEPMTEM